MRIVFTQTVLDLNKSSYTRKKVVCAGHCKQRAVYKHVLRIQDISVTDVQMNKAKWRGWDELTAVNRI